MRQTILIVVLVALLAVAGYLWIRSPAEPPPVAPAGTEAGERLKQYRHLGSLKPDLGIFSNPIFQSLQQTLPSPAPGSIRPGKANPFSPL